MGEVVEKAWDLDDRAIAAKSSKDEADRLIGDFYPYLHKCAAKYSQQDNRHYEELFSTAVLAFYESIQSYVLDKGHFFSFANHVIHNRLMDHLRKLYKHEGKSFSLEGGEAAEHTAQSAAIENVSMRLYESQHRQEQLAEEIEQFKAELAAWGITMEALTEQSPKHKALMDSYRMAIQKITQQPDMVQTIRLKHYFPIKAISLLTGLNLKKLERARTFLLASLILKTGDYELLSNYVEDRR